jgi:hypothetical protein
MRYHFLLFLTLVLAYLMSNNPPVLCIFKLLLTLGLILYANLLIEVAFDAASSSIALLGFLKSFFAMSDSLLERQNVEHITLLGDPTTKVTLLDCCFEVRIVSFVCERRVSTVFSLGWFRSQ